MTDLSAPRRVHVVGVGGAGMSAIAIVLAGMGHEVTGSDSTTTPFVAGVEEAGVPVTIGYDAANVGAVDAVTASTAVPASNPEVAAAADRGIPVLRRAETLAAMCATQRAVAVAGTHGKTTTSSMLAWVLLETGRDPSFVVGGVIGGLGSGARWGSGGLFVVEADESDGTFVTLPREAAVVTSVEPDHLDHWGDFDALLAAFDRFVAETPGLRLVSADDPVAAGLAARHGAVSYAVDAPGAGYRAGDLTAEAGGGRFLLERDGSPLGEVRVPMPGRHNAANAVAALAAAIELGVPFDEARDALATYPGVARRFQSRGEYRGATLVEDYAHLPTEVRAALAAARDGDWRRIVCAFQPHRYTRTAALAGQFADAFEGADVLIVTDVYPAGEAPIPGVTGLAVARAVLDAHPAQPLAYLPDRASVAGYLRERLRPGDLCLVLSAGDLGSVPDDVVATPS